MFEKTELTVAGPDLIKTLNLVCVSLRFIRQARAGSI